MSEVTNLSLQVGVQFTQQLEIGPAFVLLTNKSPYDLLYSGFGTPGVEWAASGTERKLYRDVKNDGKLVMTPVNNANVSPPNPAIVLITQYLDGEEPKGTWPVSIPFQAVATSTVGTSILSNEGNPTNTEVIDIGTNSISRLVDIFNDHFLWSVQQSGVAHQVLKGQTAGNPLQIGQLNDISEVLGALTVDQDVTIVGTQTVTAGATAGTATMVQTLRGYYKTLFVFLSGFQNNSVSDQSVAVPVPFINKTYIRTTNINPIGFKHSGLSNNIICITALGSPGVDGTTSNGSTMNSWSIAQSDQIDTILYKASTPATHTGLFIIDGS